MKVDMILPSLRSRQLALHLEGVARTWDACALTTLQQYPLEQVVMDRLCKSQIPGNKSPDRKTWCTMVVRRTLGCHDE